jgi:RNA polymerase sigma factor (sigma-70 family)
VVTAGTYRCKEREDGLKVRFLDAVLREAASAAADHGDGPLADADLLRRFAVGHDHAAFAALVKRHARLVWAVCRQVVAAPGDAEDAFQATWLVLVRHADSIRNGTSLPAWLHGTAYRACLKANRTAVRRRGREEATAPAEASRPIPDSAWGALLTAVHEEIARLPSNWRTAFVVCDLEGVPPGAAAARLGWKPGTLTGRLCKARQALVSRLTRRGLAPAAALAGCGVGAATAAASVPSKLLADAASLPATSAAIPSTIFELAKAVTEGTMTKTKLLAAGILVAGVLGLSGTASVLAQRPGQSNNQPPGPGGGPGFPGGPGVGTPGGQPPGGAGGAPGQPGMPGGMGMAGPGAMGGTMTRGPMPGGHWEYKVEPLPGSHDEFVNLLEKRGNEGWEYCGTVGYGRAGMAGFGRGGRGGPGGGRTGGRGGSGSGGGPGPRGPGNGPGTGSGPGAGSGAGGIGNEAGGEGMFEIGLDPLQEPRGIGPVNGAIPMDVVFKRPKGNFVRTGGGMMGGGGVGGNNPLGGGAPGAPGGFGGSGGGGFGGFGGSTAGGGGGSGFGGFGGTTGSGSRRGGVRGNDRGPGLGNARPGGEVKVFTLKKAKAPDIAAVVSQVFRDAAVTLGVDEKSNSIILKGDAKDIESVEALIAKLDELDRSEGGSSPRRRE